MVQASTTSSLECQLRTMHLGLRVATRASPRVLAKLACARVGCSRTPWRMATVRRTACATCSACHGTPPRGARCATMWRTTWRALRPMSVGITLSAGVAKRRRGERKPTRRARRLLCLRRLRGLRRSLRRRRGLRRRLRGLKLCLRGLKPCLRCLRRSLRCLLCLKRCLRGSRRRLRCLLGLKRCLRSLNRRLRGLRWCLRCLRRRLRALRWCSRACRSSRGCRAFLKKNWPPSQPTTSASRRLRRGGWHTCQQNRPVQRGHGPQASGAAPTSNTRWRPALLTWLGGRGRENLRGRP